jgi:hypothetical protein
MPFHHPATANRRSGNKSVLHQNQPALEGKAQSIYKGGGRRFRAIESHAKYIPAQMCISAELQKILLDDLVTAFQNRINVLIRAQDKRTY